MKFFFRIRTDKIKTKNASVLEKKFHKFIFIEPNEKFVYFSTFTAKTLEF